MKSMLIIGAGGHAKVVADTILAQDKSTRIAFLDDRYPGLDSLAGWPVIGKAESLATWREHYDQVIVAIGDNKTRLRYVQECCAAGFALPCVVHPLAYISPSARLDMGTVVFAGAVVQPEACLGMACIVNTGATVDHDCELGEGVHVSPGAHLGGGVKVDACSWIGIGACVRESVRLGRNVMVGAGAAVVADVQDGAVVTGVPARMNPDVVPGGEA